MATRAEVTMFKALKMELEAKIDNLVSNNHDLREDIGVFRKDLKIKDMEIDRLNGLLKLGRAEQGKIWLDAWLAVATPGNSINRDTSSIWADSALEEYNKRFNKGAK